ncbi:MAG: hydantoinase/oxoprolinase family protein, partial [Pseudomonadota bacterium]|nr:hydantoinase/oxoprolinase family protein [Pseudomonadota bacterium]
VVPLAASVLSAWGMLNTDLRVELMRSLAQTRGVDIAGLSAAFAEMEQEGYQRIGGLAAEIDVRRSADMRYGEQVFEITVPLDGLDWTGADGAAAIEEAFHRRHEALYTYALRDRDVVLVNARASVVRRLPPAPRTLQPERSAALPTTHRRAYIGNWSEVPVFDFGALGAGQWIAGPAIVEAETTTVLLRPDDSGHFDRRGWLAIEVGQQLLQPQEQSRATA